MGRILDHIKKLYSDLSNIEDKIEISEDKFKKIELRYETLSLKEVIDLSKEYLKSLFSNEEINALAKEVLSQGDYEIANTTLEQKNDAARLRHVEHQQTTIKTNQTLLNKLLAAHPNCADENDPEHKHYLEYTKHIEYAQNQLANDKLPTLSIFSVLSPEQTDSLIKKIAEKVDQLENEEEIEKNLVAIKPIDKSDKDVIYPVKDKLKEVLKKNPYLVGEIDRIILNDADFINEITAIDSRESILKMFNEFAREIERAVEANVKVSFAEGVKEYQLEDIADKKGGAFAQINTLEQCERIYNDEFKLEFSESTKHTFAYLLLTLESKNLVSEGSQIHESGNKEYAFTKFAMAQQRLIAAINPDEFNPDEFLEAYNGVKEEVRKIEEMYAVLEKNVGSDYNTMPTNVENYRNKYIPRRFKQNLVHNAQINSLNLTLAFLKLHDITIDEFVRNPTDVIKNAFEEDAKKFKIDNVLKGKKKHEAIYELASQGNDVQFDIYGYLRVFEFMNAIEKNPENKRKNALVAQGMLERFGHIKNSLDLGRRIFKSPSNVIESLQNIILAEDNEGIDYTGCYSQEVGQVTEASPNPEYTNEMVNPSDGFVIKDKPTSIDKIAKIDFFDNKYYEALAMIKNYHKMIKENPDVTRSVSIKHMVAATQELCAKYLLTHDIERWNKEAKANGGDEVVSRQFVQQLINFIENPDQEETLSSIYMNEMGNPNLANIVKNKKSLYAAKEKTMARFVKDQENSFIKLFNEINKKMDKLDERVDKISKRGETNEEIEAIGMQHRQLYNQLLAAQNERIEQLRHEYETGKISKYYYEKRVEQVNTLQNLEQIPPLFEIDEPQYKDFKTYKKHVINEIMKKIENGEEAKMPENDEELKEEYKRILDRLECDKFSYLADRVLNDNGIKVLKSLSSENKFAVSSQLLNINEEVYREEYTQYIEHNQKVNTQLLTEEQNLLNDDLLAPQPIEVPDASDEIVQINEQTQPIEDDVNEIGELPYDMQKTNKNVI